MKYFDRFITFYAFSVVQYKQGNRPPDSIFKSKEAFIVENLTEEQLEEFDKGISDFAQRPVFWGGPGDVFLKASIQKSLISSGSDLFIDIHIKNGSTKRVRESLHYCFFSLLFMAELKNEIVQADRLTSNFFFP